VINLSRTATALLGVLFTLIVVSAVLWVWIGTGKSEVDPRIADTLQNFTCEKCGHNFALTMGEVSRMRRSQSQICCPKCGAAGAHKDVLNRPSPPAPDPKAAPPGAEKGAREALPGSTKEPARAQVPDSALQPTTAPSAAPRP
jgi:predicted RNA-binding Zn-ribbon protein involved in translation (DUF1610 family)